MTRISRFAALIAAMLFLAAPAVAETCQLNDSVYVLWTAIATTDPAGQWTGTPCAPSADDTFVVDNGSTLFITANVGAEIVLTTGSIEILAGGRVVLQPGAPTTIGGHISIKGGELDTSGTKIWQGRIASKGAMTVGEAGTTIVNLPGNLTGSISATTDKLLILAEDPDPGSAITGEVQTGPGAPAPGVYRPSFSKRRWFDIKTVAYTGGITAVTLANDAFIDGGGAYLQEPTAGQNQCSGIDTPYFCCSGVDLGPCLSYQGTRAPALVSALAPVASGVISVGAFGMSTELRLADAGNTRCEQANTAGMRGDLGDQYVEWTTGPCTGKLAKIRGCQDDASGTDDAIWVMGDATQCTEAGQFIIHNGLRPGDPVAVVRPATVNGNGTGWISWTGGIWKNKLAQLNRLGPGATSALTPGLPMGFNIVVAAESATVKPDFANSVWEDVEIGWGEPAGASDTVVLMVTGLDNTQNAARFSGAPLDATGFHPRRVYIHDQVTNDDGHGLHGIGYFAAKGAIFDDFRIERLGDDSVFLMPADFGVAANANSVTMRRFDIDANFAGTANSQQALEGVIKTVGNGADNSITRGTYLFEDFMIAGYSATVTQAAMPRGTYRGFISAGISTNQGGLTNAAPWSSAPETANSANASKGCVGPGDPIACCSGAGNGCAFPARWQPYAGVIEDSLIYVENKAASNATLIGQYGSGLIVEAGDALIATLLGAQGLSESLVDLGTGASSGVVMQGIASPDWRNPETMAVRDSILIARGGRSICSSQETNLVATFNRVYAGFLNTSAGQGVVNNCDGAGGSESLTFKDWTGTVTTRSAIAFGSGANGGLASVTNACHETDAPPAGASAYGSLASSTTFTGDDFGPGPGEATSISAILDSNPALPCGKPASVGWTQFRVPFAMMGDLVISDVGRFSSRKLITPVAGSGSGGSVRVW